MKKSIFFIFALCALFSCSREETLSPMEDVCIIAGRPDSPRSSYFGSGDLMWTCYDRISILDGVGNREFTTYTTEPQRSVPFYGQVASKWTKLIGVYPYNADNSLLADGNVSMVFPACQIAAEGGFTDGANSSVGVTTTTSSLEMKNACAYIRFSFTSSKDVRLIYIAPNANGINISGRMEVDPSTAALVKADNGGNCVSLVPAGEKIAPGTYYAAVAPARLSKGLRVFFRMADGKLLCKTGSTTAKLFRNKTLDLGTINVDKLPIVKEASMDKKVLTIDFSSASSAFSETLPSALTTGEKTYYTKDGGYPVTFLVNTVEEGGNTRGEGWKYDKRLMLYANNYYQDGNTEYLDGITLPVIPGKCLVRVEVEAPANTYPMVVTNSTCTRAFFDDDYATQAPEKYNSNGNWLPGTHGFTLPITTTDDACRLVVTKSSSFCYISYITLYYETIAPGRVTTSVEPDPDDTKPTIDNLGFEAITDGGNLL